MGLHCWQWLTCSSYSHHQYISASSLHHCITAIPNPCLCCSKGTPHCGSLYISLINQSLWSAENQLCAQNWTIKLDAWALHSGLHFWPNAAMLVLCLLLTVHCDSVCWCRHLFRSSCNLDRVGGCWWCAPTSVPPVPCGRGWAWRVGESWRDTTFDQPEGVHFMKQI